MTSGNLNKKTESVSAGTERTIEVTIHYHRYDNKYTNWNAWLWAYSYTGKTYNATGSDAFGIIIKGNVDKVDNEKKGIGFIMKQTIGSDVWGARDTIGADRFIPNDKILGDVKAEIWVVEASAEIYYSLAEADLSAKVLSAQFRTPKVIDFKVTEKMTDNNKDGFYVEKDGARIESTLSSTVADGITGVLTLAADADYAASYVVKSDYFKPRIVTLDKVYYTKVFEDQFTYNGELGAIYHRDYTIFRVWSPTASAVAVNFYVDGNNTPKNNTLPMTMGANGVWEKTVFGDLDGTYYSFDVTIAGVTRTEAMDPYAKTGGANGLRAMVIDMEKTNPRGWAAQKRPTLGNNVDAVIYEAHVRDFTKDASSGVSASNRGKYLGFTEKGTTSNGQKTGIDHLKELGVTEVHLNPVYDFASSDETAAEPEFNWGYDPQNYNMPEGSYSSDAFKGEVRVKEFKEMVMALHNAGIRVIMDVVYNHTAFADEYVYNLFAPKYFHRTNEEGNHISVNTGCGNEVASERSMVRKYMLDSVKLWVNEYKIDGFRFDIMALHDHITLNMIHDQLKAIDPSMILYGEGWSIKDTAMPSTTYDGVPLYGGFMDKATRFPGIGVFNSSLRDGVKGEGTGKRGYVNGNASDNLQNIKNGIMINNNFGVVSSPAQVINYNSAHDDYTLWDNLSATSPSESIENRIKQNNLAAAINFTVQGVPFMLAGEDILRTKPDGEGGYDHNSYKSPDSTNSIKWDTKNTNITTFNYYKGLIAIRKNMDAFRKRTKADINSGVSIWNNTTNNVVGFTATGTAGKGGTAYVVYNPNSTDQAVTLPANQLYYVYAEENRAQATPIRSFTGGSFTVKAYSAIILASEALTAPAAIPKYTVSFNNNGGTSPEAIQNLLVEADDVFSIPEDKNPTKDSLVLTGWFDAASGGTKYLNSDGSCAKRWDKGANGTLYAQWGTRQTRWNVSFNSQGGSVTPAQMEVEVGVAFRITVVPVIENMDLTGWFSATMGGTKYLNADGSNAKVWDAYSNLTLYAQYTPTLFTIEFNSNGGSTPPPKVQVKKSDVVSSEGALFTALIEPVKPGSELLGWFTARTGGTKYLNADGSNVLPWKNEYDGVLFAQWSAHTYTITFDTREGSPSVASIQAKYGDKISVSVVPTRAGFEFEGWYDVKNDIKYINADGSNARPFENVEDTELVARWMPVVSSGNDEETTKGCGKTNAAALAMLPLGLVFFVRRKST